MCYYQGHKLKGVNNLVFDLKLKFLCCSQFSKFSKMFHTGHAVSILSFYRIEDLGFKTYMHIVDKQNWNLFMEYLRSGT